MYKISEIFAEFNCSFYVYDIYYRFMGKELLKKITEKLKQNSLKFSLEGYISDGRYYVGEIFVYKDDAKNELKKILDRDLLKEVKISNSYSWYLGDRRKTTLIKLDSEVELTIPEFEAMQTENYAPDNQQSA
jgi:hypothetical protein